MNAKFIPLLQDQKFLSAVLHYDQQFKLFANKGNDKATTMARELTALQLGNNDAAEKTIELIEEYRQERDAQPPATEHLAPKANGHSTADEVRAAEVRGSAPNAGSEAEHVREHSPKREPERLSFAQIAEPLVALGIPVTPVRAESKSAFLPDWPTSATTDLNQIAVWDRMYGRINCAAVATGQPDGIWIFETDDLKVLDRIHAETGHDLLTEVKTFLVRSRQGRGHIYFRNTPAALEMGNLPQTYVQHGDFSVRVRNQYVVAAGSIHPESKQPYECLTPGVAPLPAPEWLVQWLVAQRLKVKTSKGKDELIPVTESGKIPHGYIHGWIVSQAGKMRNIGMSVSDIEEQLLKLVHAHCEPPIDEEKVKQVARSFEKYAPNPDSSLPISLNQKPDGPAAAPPREIDTGAVLGRPVFPYWAIMGTSIWDGLVAPALQSSSKHAEFIYMPAAQAVMNYLSGRVTIGMHKLRLNLFVGLVSPYGEFFKSSSCQLAHDYCRYMGLCAPHSKNLKNSNGQTLIGQAGSPEGFGLVMQKANCYRAILYNDELGKFASKAGIESSAFADDLLTWYESGDFGNNVTTEKNNFHFESGSYTFGWLWCTTDRGFNRHWPKLAGIVSGLEDRMFFIVSPERPKPAVPFHDPMFVGAAVTRKRIDDAVQKQKYEFEDPAYFSKRVAGMDPRSMALVMKFALFLTIDMGKDVIDDDIIERSLALVEYRNQVSTFLEPIEADNQQGRLQKEIIRELKQHGGQMTYRELCRNLDFNRFGLDVWNRAYRTMLPYGNDEGIICEWWAQTTAGKRSTRMVGLIKFDDDAGAETAVS